MISGSVAGLLSLSIFVPADLLKCRAQMTTEGNLSYINEFRAILANHGVRGLYRGFWASALRDVPGWAAYFASFEYLKQLGHSNFDQPL